MIRSVAYRAALSGIVTGILLAIARITGETAPLLFTALNNQFWSTNLNAPMASLPVTIFQFALSPYEEWQQAGLDRRADHHLDGPGAQHRGPQPHRDAERTDEQAMTVHRTRSLADRRGDDGAEAKIEVRNLNFYYGQTRR